MLIQLSASLSLLLDIAIKRILADKDIEFQLQAATDVFRRGMGGKLLPDEVLNVWLQPVKSIFWQGFMTPFPCQRIRSPAGVNAVKSGVGIASEFPADGDRGRSSSLAMVAGLTPSPRRFSM
ncbi:hypothetical protein EWM60_15310 [Candidatus Erwinia dacicola]|nr:hypothetical protein [Candidatus Erwinia dacicola]